MLTWWGLLRGSMVGCERIAAACVPHRTVVGEASKRGRAHKKNLFIAPVIENHRYSTSRRGDNEDTGSLHRT